MLRFLLFFTAFFQFLFVFSQNLQIGSVNSSAFPQIDVEVKFTGEKPQATDFKIFENDKRQSFDFTVLEDKSNTGGGNAYCFLIETSAFTSGNAINVFKYAVSSAVESAGKNDYFNVCIFKRTAGNGKASKPILSEFTKDKNALMEAINAKVFAYNDSIFSTDVFKSVYETLEWFNDQDELPAKKSLFVFSAGIDNQNSPLKVDDCIEKANESNIPVYTFAYRTNNKYAPDNLIKLSSKTNAKMNRISSKPEAEKLLKSMIEHVKKNNVTKSYLCNISFESKLSVSEESFSFLIDYKGKQLLGEYDLPDEVKATGKMSNLSYIIIGGVLVIVIGVFLILRNGKKKKQTNTIIEEKIESKAEKQKEKVEEQKEENKDLHVEIQERKTGFKKPEEIKEVNPPTSKKLLQTMIIDNNSGGMGETSLFLELNGRITAFPLIENKTTIGRATENDIVIDHTTISNKHAVLEIISNQYILTDLNSTNGVMLNGEKVKQVVLKNGDKIRLGQVQLKFQS